MLKAKHDFIAAFVLPVVFILTLPITTQAQEKKLLVVHSYHLGYAWVDAINQGLDSSLEGCGATIENFYMDTKRNTSEEWKTEVTGLVKQKLADFEPDVVITVDDAAQALFAKDYAGQDGAPQFVFCGVNAEPEEYGYPAANVTGILERFPVGQSSDFLLSLIDNINTMAIIADDGITSTTSLDYIRTLDLPVQVVSYDQPSTFDEWKSAVILAQSSADAIAIIMYHTVKSESDGMSMDPQEVMAWTIANITKPTIGVLAFAVEDGVFCGMVESGEEHGQEAGAIAKQMLLEGKTAEDFPMKTAEKYTSMLNLNTAEALGISIPNDILETIDVLIDGTPSNVDDWELSR